jgi:OHCU decarboxylase
VTEDGGRAIARLNAMPAREAEAALRDCCGSSAWVARMLACRPFAGAGDLRERADASWAGLSTADRLEAFRAHPRIGERRPGGEAGRSAAWSAEEQSGVAREDPDVRTALAQANAVYEARFGHVFLVCATGKSVAEILAALRERLSNGPDREIEVAAEEQRKITRLRLEKLMTSLDRV